jgi:hypothetical protein
MALPMMQVWIVRVPVNERFVPMPMTVRFASPDRPALVPAIREYWMPQRARS